MSSETGATELIGVDTKEAVVSSEAEESREEDVELPSSALESRGKVVYWPQRALVPDREVEQGVRAVRDVCARGRGVFEVGCRWADIFKRFT